MKCLYKVQEIVGEDLPVEMFLYKIIKHLWGGWQYPNITRVKITFEDKIYKEPGWDETDWVQSSDIVIDEEVLGKIEVYYTQFKQMVTNSQFLPKEQKLLNTIASQIGNYIFGKRLKKTLDVSDSENPKK
ncbi:MAG: GAF domain-containing protein [Bacteroidales bacterium]|nr:GAF domain-containing protein [Bacteroidales bacterium]